MGRPRKQSREPYWLTRRQCYYVHQGNTTVRLSPDKEEAWRLWHALMARPPEERKPVLPTGPDAEAVVILEAFLDWCQRNKAKRTYDWYRENIQRFAEALPKGLKVGDLKPYHLTKAMEPYAHWANNTKHDFIAAAKRAFSWAVDEEMIDRNPLGRVKKPAREAREMAVSAAEYAEVIEAIPSPAFRDLIELSWETGARVQELRKIEARFFDGTKVIFPPRHAKGKKYHRVIYLTPRAREIIERMAAERPEGAIVVNSDGNPWTKNAINCAFCRLQLALGRKAIAGRDDQPKCPAKFKPGQLKRAGAGPEDLTEARTAHQAAVKGWQKDQQKLARELGKKYHLGAFRKGYATEALKAGVDVISLARLLGHRDPSMLSRVYAQVQSDPEYMAEQAVKAKKPRQA